MLEGGDAGDVLVLDIVLTLLGRQRPQLLDGSVQVASRPQHRAFNTSSSTPSWSSCPVRYACMICPRLPWRISRASLWRDSYTVSCRFICLR